MEGEEHLEIYRRLREEIGMKTCLHGPIDYAREYDETAISCRGPEPARKKTGIPVVGRRKMHSCALVAKKMRVEPTL